MNFATSDPPPTARRAGPSRNRLLCRQARRRVRWTAPVHTRRNTGLPSHHWIGPLLWLAKSAITPTQDTLRMPMALWPTAST